MGLHQGSNSLDMEKSSEAGSAWGRGAAGPAGRPFDRRHAALLVTLDRVKLLAAQAMPQLPGLCHFLGAPNVSNSNMCELLYVTVLLSVITGCVQ